MTIQISTPDFVIGNKGALLCQADLAEASRVYVGGLNNHQVAAISRNTTDIMEFNKVDGKAPTNRTRSNYTGSGNYVPADPGFRLLSKYLVEETTDLQNIWIYLVKDFVDPEKDIIYIPDTKGNATGSIDVIKATPGAQSTTTPVPAEVEISFNIALVECDIHMFDVATPTITFVSGTPDTILDSAGGFVTKGFRPGDLIYIDDLAGISGGVSNAGKWVTIAAGGVAAGVLTLEESGELVTDATGASTVVLRSGYYK